MDAIPYPPSKPDPSKRPHIEHERVRLLQSLSNGLATSNAFTRIYPQDTDWVPDPIPDAATAAVIANIKRDHDYEAALAAERAIAQPHYARITAEHAAGASDWLGPYADPPASTFRPRFPAERKTEGEKGKRSSRPFPLVSLSKKDMRLVANTDEILIPIRLEIEHEGRRLLDTFTWNLNEPCLQPADYAKILCADMLLPVSFVNSITASIAEQIKEYQEPEAEHPRSAFVAEQEEEVDEEQDTEWWGKWRDIVTGNYDPGNPQVWPEDLNQEFEDSAAPADEDLRILIKLDITIDVINVNDQFEWDISNLNNSPEKFAAQYATDLGLVGEFETAIAHSIREQIEAYYKCLSIVKHIKGEVLAHDELRMSFLPPLEAGVRYWDTATMTMFTPTLEYLGPDELDRIEKERERESRKKKRGTRGRRAVVTLPERDPLKTIRTLLPKHGASLKPSYLDENEVVVIGAPDTFTAYQIERPYVPMPERLAKPLEEPPPLNPSNLPNGGEAGMNVQRSFKQKVETFRKPDPKKPKLVCNGPNYINGLWHCMNCGVPEPIAVGRRKGPEGSNTLCGECGKHLSWTKKMLEVVYNTDPNFHLAKKKKKGGNTDGEPKPRGRPKKVRTSASPAPSYNAYDDQAYSPVSSRGYSPPSREPSYYDDPPAPTTKAKLSEPPRPGELKIKLKRKPDTPSISTTALPEVKPVPQEKPYKKRRISSSPEAPILSAASTHPPIAVETAPFKPDKPTPPRWMLDAAHMLRSTRPYDQFEILPRPKPPEAGAPTEWRLKCLDCPGKLYTPGPDQTLDNFEVHLKNRHHKANVVKRAGPAAA